MTYLSKTYAFNTGSAYFYINNDGLLWSETSKVVASDGSEGSSFGYSVGLHGNTAVIGSHLDDSKGMNSGAYLNNVL